MSQSSRSRRAEQRTARALASEQNISYAQALQQLRNRSRLQDVQFGSHDTHFARLLPAGERFPQYGAAVPMPGHPSDLAELTLTGTGMLITHCAGGGNAVPARALAQVITAAAANPGSPQTAWEGREMVRGGEVTIREDGTATLVFLDTRYDRRTPVELNRQQTRELIAWAPAARAAAPLPDLTERQQAIVALLADASGPRVPASRDYATFEALQPRFEASLLPVDAIATRLGDTDSAAVRADCEQLTSLDVLVRVDGATPAEIRDLHAAAESGELDAEDVPDGPQPDRYVIGTVGMLILGR